MASEPEDIGFELCLMRHGIAVDRAAGGVLNDAERTLTPEGKERMQQIARGLAATGFTPDWVVSSPYLRAAETGEIVAASCARAAVPFDLCEALEPGGAVPGLLAFLARHSQRRRVLVVGHEPDLSEWAASLTGAGRHANFGFKKGGCCLICFEQSPPRPPGRLVWWLTPRVLRELA
ncbi:MAG TPA: phosphohistidine phosphatase SixA [Terriglobia bacterium]|nr:phosphohistidine phosphatase SixA [Terriglobia bacterium]